MKKLILAFSILMSVTVIANAQSASKMEKKTETKMAMKEHVCTAACANGNHVYAHGEKGHVCTEACKKMAAAKPEMKEHVCTAACANGKHMYAHGEKGHVCTDACKKM